MGERKIRAVLFDMDETLIEHNVTGLELVQGTYRTFANHLEHTKEEDFVKMLWQKANDLWQMMFDGVITGDVARPYTIINTLRALKEDDSLAPQMLAEFEHRLVESTELLPSAHEVLDVLREAGLRTGIVTNGYSTMQTRKLSYHSLPDHVDFTLVSEQVGSHKPDAAIFHEALRQAGTPAENTVFVGDNLNADICGAQGVGMLDVLIDPRGERREKLKKNANLTRPTKVIEMLTEVLPIAGLASVASVRTLLR